MTADDKYSLLNKDILTQPIKMQLSKKQKPFHESFSAFFNLAQILNIFTKNITLVAYLFPMFRSGKVVVIQMPKISCFRRPFDNQHVKRSQTLLKSAWQHLYHNDWSLWRKLSWKKFLFVICKILRLFVNILPADDKFSLLNRNNLTQPIQVHLSKKQKTFSDWLSAFFHSRLNFEHFE